jgi:hypothetical protein
MREVFRTQYSGPGCRAQVVKLLHYFMGHVESAAAEFCTGKGKGWVRRPFDEKIDIQLHDPRFRRMFEEQEHLHCGYPGSPSDFTKVPRRAVDPALAADAPGLGASQRPPQEQKSGRKGRKNKKN